MSNLSNDQQEVLQKMIRENDTEDNTSKIRRLKHSAQIRRDVSNIRNIKRRLKTRDFHKLDAECQRKCSFLFNNYTIIYNKMIKDEIDIQIMYKFLDALQSIEDGKRNQHEASYEIGMLLKQLYVDKKINKKSNSSSKQDKTKSTTKPKKISYEEFKKMQEDKEKND